MDPKIKKSEIDLLGHRYGAHSCGRSDEDGFSRTLVVKLIEELETEPLPHLTPNEHAHLLVLIQTTLEVGHSVIHFYLLLMILLFRLMSNAARWTQMDCDMLYPCVLSISSTVASDRIPAAHRSMGIYRGNLDIESVSDIAIWSGLFTARAKSCCSTPRLLRAMARCAGPTLGHLVSLCGFIHKNQ